MKETKCRACNKKIEYPYLYCSVECACYDGAYSVKTGWKKPIEFLYMAEKENPNETDRV